MKSLEGWRLERRFKKDATLTSFCTNICLTLPLPKSEVIFHQSQIVSVITINK